MPYNGAVAGITDLFIYGTIDSTNIIIELTSSSNPNTTFDIYYWLSETEEAS